MSTHQRGLTRAEGAIIAALAAILLVVAVPVYRSAVLKSHRADAKNALAQSAEAMERWYGEYNTYANAAVGASGVVALSDKGYYRIRFRSGGNTNTNETGYKLIASPVGSQAEDPCGALTLDHAGERGAATGGCW
jgi:type IV pilus assembly protein PilE